MSSQNKFPKIFAAKLDDSQMLIESNSLIIHIDQLRKLAIHTCLDHEPEKVFFRSYCIDENGNQIREKILPINIRLKCSNAMRLKLPVFDCTSREDIIMPNPGNKHLKISLNAEDDQQPFLDAKQLTIQYDNERLITIEIEKGEEITVVSHCNNDKGERSEDKFAVLNIKPGACNTFYLDINTHDRCRR